MKIEKIEKNEERKFLIRLITNDSFIREVRHIYKPEYVTEPTFVLAG